ncbi:axonemal dynein light intermediate polypeptide 1-like [Homalodisca vitripennis]|uniref:axonemal dynein light intermediate polypeptide 1-like n=1 Tax=Homalodisca vitripennis TaxID=197043 RepID=UPI001EE9FE4D|nr:axonemal dynein light intermediate polypeptide 1-like [Homalodisca vitripennis]KAG8319867.1 28 kDa inner dynein arm light chain, axonemal [Homalodisca vitripennis]
MSIANDRLSEVDTLFHSGVEMVRYDDPVMVVKDPESCESVTDVTQRRKPPRNPYNVHPMADTTGTLHDVLNCIRPPREWEDKGVLWRQYVSRDVVVREDVPRLGETLETALREHMARERPICVKRFQLIDEYFSEIIRQVTVDCVERGLLFLRVREYIKEVLSYYRGIYESSLAFSSDKVDKALAYKCDKRNLVVELKSEIEKLDRQVVDLKLQVDLLELNEEELAKNRQKKHNKKVQAIETSNNELRLLMSGMIVPSSKKKSLF